MGKAINNDIFRLQTIDLSGMSRKAYRLHRELLAELEAEHVALAVAA